MKCGVCTEEWTICKICPTCWNKMIEFQSGDGNWTCTQCGNDLSVESEDVDEGVMVHSIVCTTCKKIYRMM